MISLEKVEKMKYEKYKVLAALLVVFFSTLFLVYAHFMVTVLKDNSYLYRLYDWRASVIIDFLAFILLGIGLKKKK